MSDKIKVTVEVSIKDYFDYMAVKEMATVVQGRGSIEKYNALRREFESMLIVAGIAVMAACEIDLMGDSNEQQD